VYQFRRHIILVCHYTADVNFDPFVKGVYYSIHTGDVFPMAINKWHGENALRLYNVFPSNFYPQD
jgi:hypothetical protein